MKQKQKIAGRRAKAAYQAQGSGRADTSARPANGKGKTRPGTDEFKREQSIKTSKWNRYMFIRYLDAGLFFAALYWAFMLIALNPGPAVAVALIDLLVALAVMVEMFTVLSRNTEYLVWSHRLLIVSSAISVVSAVVTLVAGQQLLFPFFSSAGVGAVFCLILLAIKLVIIRSIVRIRDRRDKRYALYQQALKYNS